jgi:hypothetical protein
MPLLSLQLFNANLDGFVPRHDDRRVNTGPAGPRPIIKIV